jgi:hypothetical protein
MFIQWPPCSFTVDTGLQIYCWNSNLITDITLHRMTNCLFCSFVKSTPYQKLFQIYCIKLSRVWSDYRRGLNWCLDLLRSLIHNSWLHFTGYCYTQTLVSTVTSSLPLLGSGFQRRKSTSCEFPNYPRPQLLVSHSNSSQQRSPRSYLTNSLTRLQWLIDSRLALISHQTPTFLTAVSKL